MNRTLAVISCLTALFVGSFANQAYSQGYTRDGALLGGIAGAVMGGAVGHNNHHQTAEGALIGGALGAVAGGVVGNQKDRVIRSQGPVIYGQPTYVYPAPVYTTQVYSVPVQPRYVPAQRVIVRRPVTMAEVINMTRSGVSETVIVAHIQSNGVATRPDVNDVILLSQEGVSDYVISAMQTTGGPGGSVVYPAAPSYRPVPSGEIYYAPVRTVERRGF